LFGVWEFSVFFCEKAGTFSHIDNLLLKELNNMLSEKRLIKKCQQYNIKAQRQLYEQHAVEMKRVCIRYVKHNADADDVLQEAFLKIFKYIPQYKGEGSFEGWMKRIVVNTALAYIKKQQKRQEQYSVDEVQEEKFFRDEEVNDAQLVDRKDVEPEKIDYSLIEKAEFTKGEIKECSTVLKEEFRTVFLLFYFNDYKHTEIAQMLGIDENTSRSRLSRAKKQVQAELYKRCIDRVTV